MTVIDARHLAALENAIVNNMLRNYAKGSDEDVRALREIRALLPLGTWVLITKEFLSNQPEWFRGPLWISKNGQVFEGHYEWRQGHSPDRLETRGGNVSALAGYYVMPYTKPGPPSIEA